MAQRGARPPADRSWAQVEVFGVAPDPAVVAALGLLLRASPWAMRSPEALSVPGAGHVGLLALPLRR